jgi:hypothetical protein
MMTLNQNKQKLYYALLDNVVPIYETDDDGNIIYYEDEEGNRIPLETGDTKIIYSKPVEFYGNIAMSGGEVEVQEFGLNLADYEAILVLGKNTLTLTETSLIWQNTKPKFNQDETLDENSADYKIVKINSSNNYDKYVLSRVVK